MKTNWISILLTDAYKISHPEQYPEGTEYVYSNITPRSSRIAGVNEVVVFGLQYFIKEYLIDDFNENFFKRDWLEVETELTRFFGHYFGPGKVDLQIYKDLHELGYLPLRIKALPEGTRCPVGVPFATIVNTDPRFGWLTNAIETLSQNTIWNPLTAATIAARYRDLLDSYAEATSDDIGAVDFQAHNFSMRGMSSLESAVTTDAGHLLSFRGSDTLPGFLFLEDYYNAKSSDDMISCSVPACYSEDTEVLTENGFVRFADLDEGVRVAQYEEEGAVSFVQPLEYFCDDYVGDMVVFRDVSSDRHIDIKVTPNHKMVRLSTSPEVPRLELFEAGDTSDKGFSPHFKIPVSGIAAIKGGGLSFLDRLLIAFQADGSFSSRSESYTGVNTGTVAIRFSLKKDRKADRLRWILNELRYEFSESKYENGYYSFRIKVPANIPLSKDFDWFSLSEKSADWATDYLEELTHWDGHKPKPHSKYYSSANRWNVEMVQAIAAIAGYKTQFATYEDPRGDRQPQHGVHLTEKDFLGCRQVSREFVPYRGKVYCVSVPSKMIVVKHNDRVAVCGNTEHAVMCAAGKADERETFKRLITETYPDGIVSIVSDTWDLWKVLTDIAPSLRDEIEARDGKVVFRPDSGDPVKIVCGYFVKQISIPKREFLEKLSSDSYRIQTFNSRHPSGENDDAVCTSDGHYFDMNGKELTPAEVAGSVELLKRYFGSTRNSKGYLELNPKVGLIYGDSITYERCERICRQLKAKGYASTNVVFGVGSYTYQYNTRDTFSIACKATWAHVKGVGRDIFKDPVTDDGTKKSACGRLQVNRDDTGKLVLRDQVSATDEQSGELQTVFEDGVLHVDQDLASIRWRLHNQFPEDAFV